MSSARTKERPIHYTAGGVFINGASMITVSPGSAVCHSGGTPKHGTGRWADVTCKLCYRFRNKEERDVF
jgi:hypothetical protein